MKTSEIIKYRRKFLGLTLEQVADAVGVNKSTILRYENGDIERMATEKLLPLAKALKCSPLYLLGQTDTPYEDMDSLTNQENAVINAYRLASDEIKIAVCRVLGVNYDSDQR